MLLVGLVSKALPSSAFHAPMLMSQSHQQTRCMEGVQDRRRSLRELAGGLLLAPLLLSSPKPASAAKSIDYKIFDKGLFNVPPRELAYPDWIEGEWDVTLKFVGADFPQGKKVPRERILADTSLAGFRKASIAMLADVGKPELSFPMRYVVKEDEGARRVVEAKAFNLQQALDAELGRGAVTRVEYDADANANRATLTLYPGATPNADRIELFWNSRAAMPTEEPGAFKFAEDIRVSGWSLCVVIAYVVTASARAKGRR